MTHSFFITGTDTGVGKTFIARLLLAAASSKGLSTLGLKPVSAGCEDHDGVFGNEDAVELMKVSTLQPEYREVNPIALTEPMAPHIAAEREGVTISATDLAKHCLQQANRADFCVIEGAGGWDVPLNDVESMPDLAVAIGSPVILVTGMRLGCINHSLLSVQAIQASGLQLAGWVANHIDPDMAAPDENFAALEQRIAAPCLGRIDWSPDQTLLKIDALIS
ncbi:MAG: dethiobiotin synthase [Gammaproteobacteria bacterium]